ncbi:MAG: response regulator [Firmicutes bacterium]|nr:response regulator [Bacillota bacterium]
MTYSIIGILASIILIINNRDVFWIRDGKAQTNTQKNYRAFLLGALAYLVTDLLWGILDSYHLITLLFADTSVHFAAMVGAVMLLARYVVSYLDTGNAFEKTLKFAGHAFFALELVFVAVNFFKPILFWFDEGGVYHAGIARYITLGIQIFMFFVTSVYTLSVASRAKGRVRLRHMTIGLFGIAMMILITIQVFFPLLPLYAMGYMLGTCLLHNFVVEDEKEDYRRELEEAAKRDEEQKRELSESREGLKDALAAAENASKAKTNFLSNMSHEIRTPLNAIIGLSSIAMSDEETGDKAKEYLGKIDESAKHLLDIINDILDMSRIESGKMTIRKEEFSLKEALDQVNTMIGGQCREKGLSYEYKAVGSVSDRYIGDAMKLKQVLLNILGNAVKFTPEGGSVTFLVEEGPHFDKNAVLKFVVSDTGIGMSKDFLPHIFEPFSLADDASPGKYGSTGLGMPICKSLLELMNGHIEVASEEGKGSTFTVTVTLGETDEESKREEKLPKEDKAKADLKGRRVLFAEDVPINADIMKMILGERGIESDHAENGKEALEMFRSHVPWYYDAIFMDMRMPVMDGLEATRAIRALDREDSKRIPIIALTANAFDDDVKRSMQAGLNAHLSKPIEPDLMFETMEKLIH